MLPLNNLHLLFFRQVHKLAGDGVKRSAVIHVAWHIKKGAGAKWTLERFYWLVAFHVNAVFPVT
jgi:hypothetical protein